jgi:Zn-dependent M28 family amino/carboxypeptidase
MLTISPQQLATHVSKLAGEIGEHNIYHPHALNAVADYITQEWRQQDYHVVPYPYTVKGLQCSNLEITRQGTHPKSGIILVGAHYDSVTGSPGANDNGSGIAALLELSRLFAHEHPAATIRFVAFVNEEPPFFYWNNMGSMIYARQMKQRKENIRYMISLETIGYYSSEPNSQHYPLFLKHFYPHTGDFIAFVSNLGSRRAMLHAVKAFRAASNFPAQQLASPAIVPGVSWSDHLSFWREGYKAFMITDTAFYRYPYYHTSQDTPDKLTYEPFARMTHGLYLMLKSLTAK